MASKDDAFFEEADISMGELTEENEQMGRDIVSELPATGSLSKVGSLRQRAPLHKRDRESRGTLIFSLLVLIDDLSSRPRARKCSTPFLRPELVRNGMHTLLVFNQS